MAMDRNLTAFLAIARDGTMMGAAQKLRLAQPSLTKRLKLLEEEYGLPLFVRRSRGMELTSAGRALMRYAEQVEQSYLQAKEMLESTRSGRRELLRIGAGPLFRRAYLPEATDCLQREFPETRIELHGDVHLRNLPLLRSGELDIVFGALTLDPMDDMIASRAISTVHLGVLCREDHPLQQSAVVDPRALAELQWILYSNDPETTAMVRGYFVRNGVQPPRFSIQTASYEFALQLVSTGRYVLPAPMELDPSFRSLGLRALPLPEPIDSFPAGAYCRYASLEYAVVRRLIDLVVAIAADGPVRKDDLERGRAGS